MKNNKNKIIIIKNVCKYLFDEFNKLLIKF